MREKRRPTENRVLRETCLAMSQEHAPAEAEARHLTQGFPRGDALIGGGKAIGVVWVAVSDRAGVFR